MPRLMSAFGRGGLALGLVSMRVSALALLAGLMLAGPMLGGRADAQAAGQGLSAPDVADLQAKLRFLGFDIETVTGIFGPQTRRAVEAFEFSIGTGDEGMLNDGEMALLNAQVAATAFERFGYRLRGYWSAQGCAEDSQHVTGLWMDDLAWIAASNTRLPLMEVGEGEPRVINVQGQTLALDPPYFSALDGGGTAAEIHFYPRNDQLFVVTPTQALALRPCLRDLTALPADLADSVLTR